ncbi:unnamed protein product [Ranitomeya imitator]|uniref:ribonuclease H n=1 Tax=Ranitomeya imitator TaxID=111125 RepID=A0ABN9MSF2_9NEOB|nr:unnamed protein product [Ranitomeya imitator]
MDPVKVQAIHDWVQPTSVKCLQKFLGFANFYRRFIANFSSVVKPLTDLTKKGADVTNWSSEAVEAFQELKRRFTSAPVLRQPDVSLPFQVEVDASEIGAGAVLSQRNSDGSLMKPCAFFSRKFSPAERNYDVGNRELLAMKWAFEEWRHWLEGAKHRIVVLTDHKNLIYLESAKRLNPRQARWSLFFSRFDFVVSYLPGSKNVKADALSRSFLPDSPGVLEPVGILREGVILSAISPDLRQALREFQADKPDRCPVGKLFVPDRWTNLWVVQDTGVGMDIQGLSSCVDHLTARVQNIQDFVVQNPILEPRIPIPDLFSGDRSRFLNFKNNCKLFLALKPRSSGDPVQQVKIIISLLRGDPQDWAFSLAPGDPALRDVDAFFLELGLLYDEPNSVDQAEKILLALCQGQDEAEVYFQKFRKWSVLTQWNECALAAIFRKGLSEALKDVMMGFPMPAGLNESMSLAIQIDRRMHYRDVFEDPKSGALPPHRDCDCAINLIPGSKFPKGRLFNLSVPEHAAMRRYVKESLEKGHIRPSSSPLGAGFFFVAKKDGSLRPCIDYRLLNKITVKFQYPLPLLSDLFARIKGASWFTKIDLRGAYNLVRIKQGDEWKTAFNTPEGHFEYLVMPFGLSNTPSVFQSFMHDIFREYLDRFMIVYLDDILVFSDDWESHVKQMDPVKVQAIYDWTQPTSVKSLQKFLGFANFYRRFIANFSSIAKPLTDLTKKGADVVNWSSAAVEAFQELKRRFASAPVLCQRDVSLHFQVEVDASEIGAGAVLSQRSSDGSVMKPCAFFSRKFSPAERNYDVGNRELLAMKWAFEEWRHWLEGAKHRVVVLTDHKNLTYLESAKRLNPRQARWSLFFSRFDFLVSYLPGSKNVKADALSRSFVPDSPGVPEPAGILKEGHVVRLHGIPENIVSDRGSQFVSRFWLSFCAKMGIDLSFSSAFHPQTNGQTERTNQTLETYLRCFVSADQDDWVSFLPLAEFALNNRASSATLVSPFFCNSGFHPRFSSGQVEPSDCPGVDTVVDRLQQIWTHVVDNLTLSQEKAQRFANRRRCVGPRLRVGDLVWLSSHHVPMKVSSPKFKPRFIGPYKISKVLNPVSFRLDLPASFAIHNVFHKSLLRRYVAPMVPSIVPPAPVLVEGELEYVVEKILDSCVSRRKLQYLVKWKGYGQEDNSWVFASDVHAADLVRAFYLAHPDRPGGSGEGSVTPPQGGGTVVNSVVELPPVVVNGTSASSVYGLPLVVMSEDAASEVPYTASFAIHNVFHRSLLRRYVVPVVPSVDLPPPVLVEGELEYVVEKILDSRFSRRKLQYLVKWKGYGQEDNSWVVAFDVHAADLVRAFHLARPDRPGGSVSCCCHLLRARRMSLLNHQTITVWMYNKYGRNIDNVKMHLFGVVNYMNKVYKTINIFVALIGIEIWDSTNQINVVSDYSVLLQRFQEWRIQNLLPRRPHDNAQFITNVDFDGSIIGLATVSGMCGANSAGVIQCNG